MNCKQGDLAVMIKSYAGNEGSVFTCIRLATYEEIRKNIFISEAGPVWVIDKTLLTGSGRRVQLAIDANIRPLRDNPGADETLTWAPVPHKEKV